MAPMPRPLAALALLAALAGCAGAPPCPPGLDAATLASAYFGRTRAGVEVVTDAEWLRFMDAHVTPAFPDGLTVLDAAGQWRGRGGMIARQRSKLLVVALPGAGPAQAMARLAPVIAAYRARFEQESVMVTTEAICLGF
jgi:hypothetical protein